MDFLFPLLAFHSIVTGFNPDRLPDLWPLPFLGLGLIVLGAVVGFAGLRVHAIERVAAAAMNQTVT